VSEVMALQKILLKPHHLPVLYKLDKCFKDLSERQHRCNNNVASEISSQANGRVIFVPYRSTGWKRRRSNENIYIVFYTVFVVQSEQKMCIQKEF